MSSSETEKPENHPRVELPKVITPEEVAAHFGWSARKVRELAKRYGTCHVLGNRMILTQSDVDEMLLRIKEEAEEKAYWKPRPRPRGRMNSELNDELALVRLKLAQAKETRKEAEKKAREARNKR